MIKVGALGLLADLGKLNDVLSLMVSLSSENFDGSSQKLALLHHVSTIGYLLVGFS